MCRVAAAGRRVTLLWKSFRVKPSLGFAKPRVGSLCHTNT